MKLPCCAVDRPFHALHSLQCNAAAAADHAAMHDTLQGSRSALLWFQELSSSGFHQLNFSLQFCYTFTEESSVRKALRPCEHQTGFRLFQKLLTFEGIPASSGYASP